MAAETPSASTKLGHSLARVLRIDLTPNSLARNPPLIYGSGSPPPPPGEEGTDTYIESEPSLEEWFQQYAPTTIGVKNYLLSLFPFLTWIGRYNWKWAYGDLVAGVTVGCVVIPQGMAYAKLAQLSPEFGLYSSFVGVTIYWFFATSKDITIGPVAVMSTLVGDIVSDIPDGISHESVASALALIAGLIVFTLGIFRLGFIVDYIPLTAIASFMTGSAINIVVGQVPTLMGLTGFNTRGPTYKVFINILKHLGTTKMDAAMGLSALVMLYLLRWLTTGYLTKRYPRRAKAWFFLSTLRTAFVILLYTMISWLVNRHRRKDPLFKILKSIPKGFKHMGVPNLDNEIIKSFTKKIPATVIVLLIEHIAISKSFGRINNYQINPSQELIAIGITNIIGPFFGAYPATGSFSRTAIKSKAGVRTPFAGVITGAVVLFALYLLTAVFYYIPSSSLSAVIIHAVGDLITAPNTVYKFWLVNPIEVVIFFVGVIVTIFSSIENGIYTTIATSGAVMLFRIAKARGHLLGKVRIHSVIGDHLLLPPRPRSSSSLYKQPEPQQALESSLDIKQSRVTVSPTTLGRSFPGSSARTVFLPLDHRDGSNPSIQVLPPYPGVFIYRFSEGFLYANAAHYTEHLVSKIFENTSPGSTLYQKTSAGDRAWNDPAPLTTTKSQNKPQKPPLKAIILDFSSVNNVDITSVQNLIDVRNQLDRYAAPEKVEWHFASINNRWTKRALASAGFGFPSPLDCRSDKTWKPVFSVAEVSSDDFEREKAAESVEKRDEEAGRPLRLSIQKDSSSAGGNVGRRKVAVVGSVTRPFFHTDLEGAVRSAVGNLEDL